MLRSSLLFLGSLTLLAACSGSSGSNPAGTSGPVGQVRVAVTDGPFTPGMVSSATIWVDEILFHRNAEGESGFLTAYQGDPIAVDLAALRNGLTLDVSQSFLPIGTYRQIRFRVTDARLVLENGSVYTVGDDTLRLTSQKKSGYKIFLDPGIVVSEGVTETVLLDFEMHRTFKPIPANDPENARQYLMKPVVRAAVVSLSGDMTGTVDMGDGSSPEDALVHVMEVGETDLENSLASTATDADGSMTILSLEPGAYDVVAEKNGLTRRVDDVQITAGGLSVVDFVIE